MEIKKEIVKKLREETCTSSLMVCKQALQQFNGNYEMAAASLRARRWSTPLSGVVWSEPDEDRIDYLGLEDFRSFHQFFGDYRYRARIELKLDKDGKPDYKASNWPERISDYRERVRKEEELKASVDNWTIPTIADIIMSSVNQFIKGIKFEDQFFIYKFTKQYANASGISYYKYIVDPEPFADENRYFVTLKFPMKDYMDWNKISFDGTNYTFNNKSVSLEALKGE